MSDTNDIPLVATTPNHAAFRQDVGEWVLKADTLTNHGGGWMGFILYEHPDGLRVLAKAYRGRWKVCGTLRDPMTGERVPVQYERVGGMDSALGLIQDLLGGVSR